jgi:hypothetical protein
MSQKIRYIFSCTHLDRKISGKILFENGLELPALYCNDCADFCNICLEITTTGVFENLHLCNSCMKKVKIMNKDKWCFIKNVLNFA